MARCHECNSQLGENDLFCPFCGARSPEPTGPELDDISSTAPTDPNVEDVPVPNILTNFSQTSDNVAPESTSEFTFEGDESGDFLTPDSEAKTAEEEIPEIAKEFVSEKPPEDGPEAKPGEGPGSPPSSSIQPGIFEARSPYNDESISKPLGELEEVEPSQSIFDSVRIMESKPQEDVD